MEMCSVRQVLTFPSAFTVETGAAHWSVLLRARAVETQCYVVAAAQTGRHSSKRASWGHSMIVDPWGVVVAGWGAVRFRGPTSDLLREGTIRVVTNEECQDKFKTFKRGKDIAAICLPLPA